METYESPQSIELLGCRFWQEHDGNYHKEMLLQNALLALRGNHNQNTLLLKQLFFAPTLNFIRFKIYKMKINKRLKNINKMYV